MSFLTDIDKSTVPRTDALQVSLAACRLPLPTRIAFIGNYLPRECGIATFTTDYALRWRPNTGHGRLFAIP